MGKGRRSVPSSANEGLWFRHRGEAGDPEGRLRDRTSTRDQQEAPFSAPARPSAPPEPFEGRAVSKKKDENPFTQFDNRHYFQGHGVYLGDGRNTRTLGRRLHPVDDRLHHTELGYLHHKARVNPSVQESPKLKTVPELDDIFDDDYNSITQLSYRPSGQAGDATTRRRFPRLYTSTTKSMDTSTTAWKSDSFSTPFSVLAATQPRSNTRGNYYEGPFLYPNRVYPPYDRKSLPAVPNILNRYGPDFASEPSAVSSRE